MPLLTILRKIKAGILTPKIISGIKRQKIINQIFQTQLLTKAHKITHQQNRYLFYDDHNQAGISHLKSNLAHYFREASQLNRSCVIKNPPLEKKHNSGLTPNTAWTQYIDFNKSQLPADYLLVDEFIKKPLADAQILVISGQYKLSEEQNRYPVIIRDMSAHPLYRPIYEQHYPTHKPDVNFHPAKIINDQANKTIKQLPQNFCAIHIRRGDRLLNNPTLKANTSPKNVLKKLQQYNPHNLPIFLMTDEKNKQFYNNLSTHFSVYRIDDFSHLVEVAKQGDNYLLFCIETLILSKAKIRIRTIKNDLQQSN